jgi:hypothetical protein
MTNYLYLTGILISVCQFVYIRLQKGQPTHTTKKDFLTGEITLMTGLLFSDWFFWVVFFQIIKND